VETLMNQTINEVPEVLGAGIGSELETIKPTAAAILDLQRQLLSRHGDLGLKPKISSEEVVESFFRCCMVHYLQQRFDLHSDAIPTCINSSHKATRRVCAARRRHRHQGISDDAWAAGWLSLQTHPGVNIRVSESRSAQRADLFIVTRNTIVSFEFKYIGAAGLRDAAACARQVLLHAANHKLAFLVLYSGASGDVLDNALIDLRQRVGRNIRLVGVCGPAIPVVSTPAA
jgi:hypothetical protein